MTPISASCSASAASATKPGRVRADERAGQQVADDRRQAQPLGDVAEDEGGGQAAGEREDQVVSMHAALPVLTVLGASIHWPPGAEWG